MSYTLVLNIQLTGPKITKQIIVAQIVVIYLLCHYQRNAFNFSCIL